MKNLLRLDIRKPAALLALIILAAGISNSQSPGGAYTSPGTSALQTVAVYSGQTTAGQGIAPILVYAATTPTTPVASTPVLNSAAAGFYRVSIYYVVTTAGTVGTSITVTLSYADAQQAQTINPALTSSGLVQGQFAAGTFVIQQQAVGNITYTIAEGGAFTIHPVLALKIALQRLA